MYFLLFWSHFARVVCYRLIPAVLQYFPWLWSLDSCDWAAVLGADGLDLAVSFGTGGKQFVATLEYKEVPCCSSASMWGLTCFSACSSLLYRASGNVHSVAASQMLEAQWCACASELGFQLMLLRSRRSSLDSRDLGSWIREEGAWQVRGMWWWSDLRVFSCWGAGSCTGERSATNAPSKLHQWLSCSLMSFWVTNLMYLPQTRNIQACWTDVFLETCIFFLLLSPPHAFSK